MKESKHFLSKYAALSGKISVEWIDPVLHPAALTEYDTSSNTIVVSCPDTEKTTTISFTDIIVYDQSSYYMTGQMQDHNLMRRDSSQAQSIM